MFSASEKMFNMVAHKLLPDAVMEVSDIEHCGYSIAEVHTYVVDGITVGGHTVRDEDTLRNVKRAWTKIISNKRYSLDATGILRCHYDVMQDLISDECVGAVRNIPVRISGCNSWKSLPLKDLATYLIVEAAEYRRIEDDIERALRVYCWLTYRQFFSDGNKRVARIMANSILSENRKGFLVCYAGETNVLMEHLCEYYETADTDAMISYLKERCLVTFDESGNPVYP